MTVLRGTWVPIDLRAQGHPLLASEKLDDVLTWQKTRQISASLTVNYQRRLCLLKETERSRALAGTITVVESPGWQRVTLSS